MRKYLLLVNTYFDDASFQCERHQSLRSRPRNLQLPRYLLLCVFGNIVKPGSSSRQIQLLFLL